MFWPLSSLSGFLDSNKSVGMFQNCLQNENKDIFIQIYRDLYEDVLVPIRVGINVAAGNQQKLMPLSFVAKS